LNPKHKIINLKTIESPDFKSWFFFVDESPYQSWEHSCYYAFVNIETGKLFIVKGNTPPKLSTMKAKIVQPIPPPGKLFDFSKNKTFKAITTYDASHDYAVIISGGIDDENNWFRYWNDCSAIYSALIDVYNYSPTHIYVLMADGISPGLDRVLSAAYDGSGNLIYTRDSSPLDLDGDGTNDIQYAATKSNIHTVFDNLSGVIDTDDHLFIYTIDHGGIESGTDVYLHLWGETMRDDEFATELNKVDAGKVTITMGQCNSGGFIDDLAGENRVISTACLANENSFSMPDMTYDEYVYHWISAISGETPEGGMVNADFNNDGWVSIREAFDYAEAEDTQDETPQYSSTPDNLGCYVRLSENWLENLSGNSPVCTTGKTFSIENFPSGATVNWTHSNF